MNTPSSSLVVIITGGSSGIGKALAVVFGQNHFKVLITGTDENKLNHALAELKDLNIDALKFRSDVSNIDHNIAMCHYALEHWGRVDILINNAGISMRAQFSTVDTMVLDRVMDINFRGALYATKACIQEIIKRKGTIIGISSIAGYRGLPGRTGYSASKFALNGFLESLRSEMLPHQVHILTACPGFTQSNIRYRALNKDGKQQNETPRDEKAMMSSAECAKHIFKAYKAKKSHLILTQQGKLTVFLNKFFPELMDKIVYKFLSKEPESEFPPL